MPYITECQSGYIEPEVLDELMEVCRDVLDCVDDAKPYFGCDGGECWNCPAMVNKKRPYRFYEVDNCAEAVVMDVAAAAYFKGLRNGYKMGFNICYDRC